MNVVEIFLPLADNAGTPFPKSYFDDEKQLLAEKFGGLTAFTRAPAQGIWTADDTADDIVIFEVMTDGIDTVWWTRYRKNLEAKFRQDAIVIRASRIAIL